MRFAAIALSMFLWILCGSPVAAAETPVIVAAGDISCDNRFDLMRLFGGCKSAQTAVLVATIHPAAVLALGDVQYPDGSLESYKRAYDTTWGRFKAITYPAIGNHEYADGRDRDAKGYFAYFGDRAGEPGKGWYSFDLTSWHLIALNGNCQEAGGCDHDSPQERWLRDDLAAHRGRCTLAFMHQPRFSSGGHGGNEAYVPFWDDLYQGGAAIVLSGHDHDYERFEPQRPDGSLDPAAGIVQFVVGTGGKSHNVFVRHAAHSVIFNQRDFGVLVLTLGEQTYDWRFERIPDGETLDSGSGRCPGH